MKKTNVIAQHSSSKPINGDGDGDLRESHADHMP
jgi:hypothetical protein